MSVKSRVLVGVSALFIAACQQANNSSEIEVDDAPPVVEADTWSHGAMVAAADPRAVEAGLEALRNGGHAVDAAIAVHTVLGLVEPQSSGIGGGAFMVVYDRESGETVVYDGRETAPMAIDENLFVEDGEVLGFLDAWQSGKSSGVPGAIALYKTAHDVHGHNEWASNFDAAIELADEGFVVSPRLAGTLADARIRQFTRLDDHPVSAAYFFPDGESLAEGAVRDNPDYAETLRRVATDGIETFYTGENAEAIVATLTEAPRPSAITVEDIAGYEVKVRPPLCGNWRDYRICSAPPPSSGGVTQNAIPGLYDRLLPEDATQPFARVRTFVDAQRLAYADRDHYVADADFVQVPAMDLINPAYLDVRATEVFEPGETPTPGDPGLALGGNPMIGLWGQDPTEDAPGTTHFSIVDQEGNVVSMTATVEAAFGNSRMVNGYLLNNELTDFARQPRKSNLPVANAPGPGKRPRSSMSPTIIFDTDGDLKMVTGSPGGNSIVAYVSKTVLAVLDWGDTAQEAVAEPNIIARGETVGVEVDVPGGQEIADELNSLGYNVQERRGENSGLHVIVVTEDGLDGGADPRREGVALALEEAPAEDAPSEATP
ncbi:MAG: gamma-glutamyltransferase family protein [Hyphomonadaceae bacterium]|nr:gamma-glutamyltransferase family protein [Hyphomonadaceae bacterium]